MARILVVDDEADIVRVVVKILEASGHTVETGRDGEEALTRVGASPPDLLIIDLNLPRMDGFEVCRRLKADPATRQVPILMMNAAYVSLSDVAVTDDSVDEYIVKPFMAEVLLNNVDRLLRRR